MVLNHVGLVVLPPALLPSPCPLVCLALLHQDTLDRLSVAMECQPSVPALLVSPSDPTSPAGVHPATPDEAAVLAGLVEVHPATPDEAAVRAGLVEDHPATLDEAAVRAGLVEDHPATPDEAAVRADMVEDHPATLDEAAVRAGLVEDHPATPDEAAVRAGLVEDYPAIPDEAAVRVDLVEGRPAFLDEAAVLAHLLMRPKPPLPSRLHPRMTLSVRLHAVVRLLHLGSCPLRSRRFHLGS